MKTNRQIQPSLRGGAGFTLIELLIVIAIIAILAALTMGAFKYATEAASRNRTTAALTAIKGALERYKEKFGEYPEPTKTAVDDDKMDSNNVHLTGAKMLYQAITGDGNNAIMLQGAPGSILSDGKIDSTELENVIDGSMPKPIIFKYDDGYYFIDGFARPFQYEKGGTTDAVNPTFDIWSFGNYEQGKPSKIAYDAATKKDSAQTGAWIKNW
ncbi:hypothetical protein BH11VER1_BH11VER1_17020 [soil metagenome]